MVDMEKVKKGLKCCKESTNEDPFRGCSECPYNYIIISVQDCRSVLSADALELLKEQEAVEPTINEYGEAYCICGENVGIIPSSKNLPSIRSKYCSECGRRMKWE